MIFTWYNYWTTGMWTYPAGSNRGTWIRPEYHLQALETIPKCWKYDNARLHRANIVEECLQSEDITRMDWPAYSPDLNPLEHVGDMLGRRIAARQPPPTCLPELRSALLDEWCNISQDQIDNLILSMPRRYKACIASSGTHTPY
ncbi:DDE_3 domain-containing protein [Trichonephila clavipes]|uniref:DDE_3 domain-containing protein n=1 Tax=Trichonephila clavipes TaxID=2585209 RepID=A0A8X7BMN6_TRICX|nr:DDE_3 domain-containing protein [Trichonephila clavipes]